MGAVHYIEKCEHGTVVAQCRCPAVDKPVHIVACPPYCPHNTKDRTIQR